MMHDNKIPKVLLNLILGVTILIVGILLIIGTIFWQSNLGRMVSTYSMIDHRQDDSNRALFDFMSLVLSILGILVGGALIFIGGSIAIKPSGTS